jgi:hypothetical protein
MAAQKDQQTAGWSADRKAERKVEMKAVTMAA